MPITSKDVDRIYIGGWFQRTTLHLSEIYDFLTDKGSPLPFDKDKLKKLRENLNMHAVEMHVDDLDYATFITNSGVGVKIYEDGLILLGKQPVGGDSVKEVVNHLTTYYEDCLGPAMNYIFSLGAPVPKELAAIKNIYPYFIVLKNSKKEDVLDLFNDFEESEYFEIEKDSFEIYRGSKLYVINNKTEKITAIEDFIQEMVFFREFKTQLHRYLNLHRILWEKIEDIKERGSISGKEVDVLKEKLESYKKTINLISARIGQMGTYLGTREQAAKSDENLKNFVSVIQYKHGNMRNTLGYISGIWGMTSNYINEADAMFASIQSQSTDTSVHNLTIVTSMGVGGTLLGLFTQNALPTVTLTGLMYFIVLAIIGFSTKKALEFINLRRKYTIPDVKIDTNIQI